MNNRHNAAQSEQVIQALAASTAHSPEEVRRLFDREYARLEAQARVRTHLAALATSNVRSMLRQAARNRLHAS